MPAYDNPARYKLLRGLAVAGSLAVAMLPAAGHAAERLGFVVREFYLAQHNSRFGDECPEGMAASNDELWWRGLSKQDRARLTNNGLRGQDARGGIAMLRGPKGENVCVNPDAVTDPPLRVVRGKYSYGANLDGTSDGQATPKTCAHEKFLSHDGKTAVDNQLYRLVGCVYGWRKGGYIETQASEDRGVSNLGMILIEITGVDNRRNDDDVTVSFYRSIDQFAMDGFGKPLPFHSYRVDTDDNGKPTYGDKVKGKIVDGVLTTARGDVSLPYYGLYTFMNPVIKDFGLTLEIPTDEKLGKGQITGYYNMSDFLNFVSGMAGHTSATDNCPSMWAKAPSLADGYPDPKTGQCTMLSSAFDIGVYPAFVVLPTDATPGKAAKR